MAMAMHSHGISITRQDLRVRWATVRPLLEAMLKSVPWMPPPGGFMDVSRVMQVPSHSRLDGNNFMETAVISPTINILTSMIHGILPP